MKMRLGRLNLALFLLCLVSGYFLFREMMIWGDPNLLLNPVINNSPHALYRYFPFSALRSALLWYQSLNGRVSQALLTGLTRELSLRLSLLPETFPAWLFRSGSLFVLIAAPMNFLFLFGRMNIPRGVLVGCAAMLAAFWILNPVTYIPVIWNDFTFHQYYLPLYLISIVAATGRPRFGLWHLLLYAFLLLCTEHYFISVPILFLAFSYVRSEEATPPLRKQLAWYLGVAAACAVVYWISPGQHWRTGVMAKEFAPDYSSPLEWYRRYVPMGYRSLFPGLFGSTFWAIFHTVLCLIVAKACYVTRSRVFILSAAFLLAYFGCLSTTVVSTYFPHYCAQIPMFYLLMAIGLALAGGYQWVEARNFKLARAAVAAVVVLSVVVAICRAPSLRLDYVEARDQSRTRRWVGAQIRRVYETEKRDRFFLSSFPNASFDTLLESEWGLRGYFLWEQLPVKAVLEGDRTTKVEVGSYEIKYADSPYRLNPRKIPELEFWMGSRF